ncbi:MAG TPA: protein adenylyltransferase SelO family protein, partial [Rhizomicrobium sp.]|nr:protein adenylyltransferase SelO family protein [Rhizomicrobium sp.]
FELTNDLLGRMAQHQADFTLMFRRLCDAAADSSHDEPVRELFVDPTAFDEWAVKWRARLAEEGGDGAARVATMRAANPAYIPRNHRVEEAIVAATAGDFAPFETLVKVLAHPYDDQPEFAAYQKPPREDQIVQQTFCGT